LKANNRKTTQDGRIRLKASESFGAEDDGVYKIVGQKPLGVCAGIGSWNAPLMFVGSKIAPALTAGNIVFHSAPHLFPDTNKLRYRSSTKLRRKHR
jgi:acyl-CoA reductase-like NAD-dependent aldehyde dehydrogenase